MLLALPLTLAGCGTIPVGSVAIPDIAVTVPATFQLPLGLPVAVTSPVVYTKENKFGGSGIPSLVNNVGVEGTARYTGAGDVKTLQVFVRQSLTNLPSSCLDLTQYVVCLGDESVQAVGTIDFTKSNPAPVSLGGPVLLSAAKAGEGYFGVQATASNVVAGDTLELTNLRGVAKF